MNFTRILRGKNNTMEWWGFSPSTITTNTSISFFQILLPIMWCLQLLLWWYNHLGYTWCVLLDFSIWNGIEKRKHFEKPAILERECSIEKFDFNFTETSKFRRWRYFHRKWYDIQYWSSLFAVFIGQNGYWTICTNAHPFIPNQLVSTTE